MLIALLICSASCAQHSGGNDGIQRSDLTGAWRSHVQFTTGAFASIKDLEFLYAFNDGGTMTESSNYDGSPPVPPAYGVWRAVGPREFEAKYVFYATRPPARFEEIANGGGWAPNGHGELTERITLAQDGRTFTSTITFESLDAAGKRTSDGGTATGIGRRVDFSRKQ
jgi:hypothetical protein